MMRRVAIALSLLCAAFAGGCGKPEPDAASQARVNVVSVTVAQATRADLPVVESAVGAESALHALDYDPTRVRGGGVHVRLPFPLEVARDIRIGQSVTLTSFAEPGRAYTGTVREIRPSLNATTLTRDVIVVVPAARGFRPEGSIRGEIVMGTRRGAITVPEQALVQRPAGDVVYVMEGEVARERPVETGVVRGGRVEIRKGLTGAETVAVDGAALLSEGAKVRIAQPSREARTPAGGEATPQAQ
jgi:hypothetical protein